MTTSALVLGIDLGTTGVRIALLDQQGELIFTSAMAYPLGLENVEDWRTCSTELIRAIPAKLSARIVALAIDATSGTLVACDKQGKPLQPALPYYMKCLEQKQALLDLIQNESPAKSVNSSLARALRLISHHGTDVLLRHQADWLNGWLLNNWRWGEEGNNVRLGWDLIEQSWPSSFTKQPWHKALPEIVSSGKVIALIDPQQANTLGLPENLFIIAGTTDANAAVLNANAGPEDGITVIGSTLVLKRFVEHPLCGPGITNHRVGGCWLCGGASNTGGNLLKQFFSDEELEELSRQINPELDSGLMLRPLLSQGERFPIDDPNLEPILEPRPVSDSLYLHGLLEGLARIEAQGWEKLTQIGVSPPKKIISMGGGARNPQWRRIRERMLKIPIQTCTTPPAAGVARLALQAISKKSRIRFNRKKSFHSP